MIKGMIRQRNMKSLLKHSFLLLVMLTLSCSDPYNDDVDPSKTNYVINPTTEPTALDNWIFDNFTAPYNIEVKYRWDVSELEINKTLVPPIPAKTQTIMNVVRDAWIVPYTQVAGETFIKTFAPKQFVLVGSPNFNPGGTITLGTAEGGRKIVLYTINGFDDDQRTEIKEQMHTVHHEFAHILHQNVPYTPDFVLLSKGDYTADWYNISLADAQSQGFITSYAMSSPDEDFVEMIATMLTEGERGFDRIVCAIPDEDAQALIRQKQQIVVNYFSGVYDINFSLLQESTVDAINEFAPESLLSELGFQQGQNFSGILADPSQLPPFPTAFQNIYDDAEAGLAAIDGAGRVLDNFALYFDGGGFSLLEFTYHNASGTQFVADFFYDVNIGAGDIFTLSFTSQNANAEVVAPGIQPLLDYFQNNSFYLDWIPLQDESCVYDLGGIFPQETPDAFCFGRLIN
jgi:substrate import-associated zinc metallohydrolase lipoprotein